MDDAIKRVRQLAASALARKEKLEEQLAALEAEKQKRQGDLDLAIASDDDDVALKLTQIVSDLEGQIDLKRGEVATAEEGYRSIVEDLRSVQDAAKEQERLVQRAPVDAVLTKDAFDTSAEDAALENVRRHIEVLDAEAELGDELGAQRKADRELERKLADIEKQEAEAKAKAQLAALKAARGKKQGGEAAPSDSGEPPPKKPKKTM